MIRLGIAGIGLIAEDYIRIISNGYVKMLRLLLYQVEILII